MVLSFQCPVLGVSVSLAQRAGIEPAFSVLETAVPPNEADAIKRATESAPKNGISSSAAVFADQTAVQKKAIASVSGINIAIIFFSCSGVYELSCENSFSG